jgi:hypothetical protein
MATQQYTIRNIPEPVNRYLRKKVSLTGKSLNQVVIDELSDKVSSSAAQGSLDWFIGSGIDDETLRALEEVDMIQKKLASEEL